MLDIIGTNAPLALDALGADAASVPDVTGL